MMPLCHFLRWYLLGIFAARFFQNHRKCPGRATRAHISSIWGTAGKLLVPAALLLKKIEFWPRAPFLRKSLTRPKNGAAAPIFNFLKKMKEFLRSEFERSANEFEKKSPGRERRGGERESLSSQPGKDGSLECLSRVSAILELKVFCSKILGISLFLLRLVLRWITFWHLGAQVYFIAERPKWKCLYHICMG